MWFFLSIMFCSFTLGKPGISEVMAQEGKAPESSPASPTGVISNIRLRDGKIVIEFQTQGLFTLRKGVTTDGRFFLDFPDFFIPRSGQYTLSHPDFRSISFGQLEEAVTRIILTTTPGTGIPVLHLYPERGQIVIASQNFTNPVSNKVRIVLDPGHGGHDSGAVGPAPLHLSEKDVTLDIALRLASLLKQEPHLDIALTREADYFVSLGQRRRMAREKTDLFISIHCNASLNRRADGVEVYFFEAESLNLARVVAATLGNGLKRQVSYVRRRPFYVVRDNPARFGAVLVEVTYISNPQAARLLAQPVFRSLIAERIALGIKTYLQDSSPQMPGFLAGITYTE